MFEVAWLLIESKYGKTKKQVYPNFGLSFCIKDPPSYLQQGGRNMTVIIYKYIYSYIYRSSRLCENWMAQNMAKQKNKYSLFHERPTSVAPTEFILYIYLYIETFEVVWVPGGIKHRIWGHWTEPCPPQHVC